jgi:hypothetical protein
MILLEVDAAGFAILEFECDAPWPIDVNRIAFRIKPMQGVKIKAGKVHLLGSNRNVKTVQSRENARVHLRIDLRAPALIPKLGEGLAFEGPDHSLM